MLEQFAALGFLVFCIAAVSFDLRERRIPDKLNYFFLVFAVVLSLLSGRSTGYLVFVAACFAFAFLLFKMGAWAGGDVKFFTSTMAFLPLLGLGIQGAFFFSFIGVFITSAFLLVPLMIIVYWQKLGAIRKQLTVMAARAMRDSLGGALAATGTLFLASSILSTGYSLAFLLLVIVYFVRVPLVVGVVLAGLGFVLKPVESVFSLAFSLAILFLAKFSRNARPVVSKRVLTKNIPVNELEDGMIPAETVLSVGGKARFWKPSLKEFIDKALSGSVPVPSGRVVADSSRAAGLQGAEIRELKKLGVKSLLVKESVPFAPVLVAGELVFMVIAWLVAR